MTMEEKVNQMTLEELRRELLKVQTRQASHKVASKSQVAKPTLPSNAVLRQKHLAARSSVNMENWGRVPDPHMTSQSIQLKKRQLLLCDHDWKRDKTREAKMENSGQRVGYKRLEIPVLCNLCGRAGTKWVEVR